MATLLEKVSFVGIYRHLTVAHRVKNNVCFVHYPYDKFRPFTVMGECRGDYTHCICKDANCNMNSDHLCYRHTLKNISNGECSPLCVYRRLISVTIDRVVQS